MRPVGNAGHVMRQKATGKFTRFRGLISFDFRLFLIFWPEVLIGTFGMVTRTRTEYV